jgi:hypothetical protein
MSVKTKAGGLVAAAVIVVVAASVLDRLPTGRNTEEDYQRTVRVEVNWTPAREMKINWLVGGVANETITNGQASSWKKTFRVGAMTRVQVGVNEVRSFPKNGFKECLIRVQGAPASRDTDDFGPPISCETVVR